MRFNRSQGCTSTVEIIHDFEQVYGTQPVLYVTEVNEVNKPKALAAAAMPTIAAGSELGDEAAFN
jgi:hypothetical protein